MRWVTAVILAVAALFACAAQAAGPVVSLYPDRSPESVHDAIRFKQDTAARGEGVPDTRDMVPIAHRSTQFGQPGDTVVGALTVRNAGPERGSWVLSTGRGLVDRFTLYRIDAAGRPQTLFDNRNVAMLGRTLSDYQAIAVPIELAPGEAATFLFRYRDNVSMWMPFSIVDTGRFFSDRRANIAKVGAIVGASLMLLLVNALVFGVTGRRAFLWLAAAEAAFAVNTVYAEGYANILWLYRWPALAELFGEFSRVLFATMFLQFGRAFLGTKARLPRLDVVLRALIAAGGVVALLALGHLAAGWLPILLIHQLGWLHLLASVMAMLVLGMLSLRRGAMFVPLIVGWVTMALYIGYMTLAISGLFPGLPVRWHWIGPIGLFECLMATISLMLHLRFLQVERIRSERRALGALLEKLALSEETKRLAEERSRAVSEIRLRDRLREESVHDTRHVLHALNSAVHFGQRGNGSVTPDLIGLLESSARHLEDIIASTVTSGQAGGRFLALRVCDPTATLAGLGDIYAPIAERAGVGLTIFDPTVARALIDEALFARLLSNLINNALKFTANGTVEVRCDSDEGLLRLTVTDTGVGMPPTVLEWLNDHAGDALDPDPSVGLGTGWRAIRDSVALMHGSYLVESTPAGSTVTVLFPNPVGFTATPVSAAELAALAPGAAIVDLAAAEPEAGVADGATVVVVADDATARTRTESAARSQLLLVRPLCREMLDHPYVRGYVTIPAARALSTS